MVVQAPAVIMVVADILPIREVADTAVAVEVAAADKTGYRLIRAIRMSGKIPVFVSLIHYHLMRTSV